MSWIWTFWSEARGNLSANMPPNVFLVSFKVTVSNSLLHIFASEKGVSDRTFQRGRFHPRLIFRDSLSWPENDIYDSFNFPNLTAPFPHLPAASPDTLLICNNLLLRWREEMLKVGMNQQLSR